MYNRVCSFIRGTNDDFSDDDHLDVSFRLFVHSTLSGHASVLCVVHPWYPVDVV